MSFVLPGNARELRFTGETRALGAKKDEGPPSGAELGKPRSRVAPKATEVPPARLARAAAMRAPASLPPRSLLPPPPSIRVDVDLDEEDPTTALVRDDVLPGALAAPRPARVGAAPIPHFRASHENRSAAPTFVIPRETLDRARGKSGGRLPLAVWLVAAVVAGVVSFYFAPKLVARAAAAQGTAALR